MNLMKTIQKKVLHVLEYNKLAMKKTEVALNDLSGNICKIEVNDKIASNFDYNSTNHWFPLNLLRIKGKQIREV